MLLDRQADLQSEVRTRIGGLRETGLPDVRHVDEDADADTQQDVDVAMIQLRAETSRQIDAALGRIDAREYGRCASCGKDIQATRLKALPFAVRCITCEAARERENGRESKLTRDRGIPSWPADAHS